MSVLQDRLARLTERLIVPGESEDAVRSAVVAIEWAGRGHAAAAAGIARADSQAPMRTETQFHIASVGKPMTAALIFQAVEEGKLGAEGVDARLIDTGVLPRDVVRRLQVMDGVSYGEAITLRQLLTHTSGLRDAQIDDGDHVSSGYGGKPAPGSIVGRRAADYAAHIAAVRAGQPVPPGLSTRKLWRPWDPERMDEAEAGLINFYLNAGMAEHGLFKPGTAFHYSDTAFTILALLAEHLLGESYHRLLRHRIFDPLEMTASFLDGWGDLDPAPYVQEVSDCWAGNVPLVSYGVTLSNDWGGGGQVCTAGDLNRFMRGLMEGRLFRKPETLTDMLTFIEPPGRPANYARVGCGVMTFVAPQGRTVIGHSGAWGAKMLAWPDQGIYASGTVNRRAAYAEWMIELVEALFTRD